MFEDKEFKKLRIWQICGLIICVVCMCSTVAIYGIRLYLYVNGEENSPEFLVEHFGEDAYEGIGSNTTIMPVVVPSGKSGGTVIMPVVVPEE